MYNEKARIFISLPFESQNSSFSLNSSQRISPAECGHPCKQRWTAWHIEALSIILRSSRFGIQNSTSPSYPQVLANTGCPHYHLDWHSIKIIPTLRNLPQGIKNALEQTTRLIADLDSFHLVLGALQTFLDDKNHSARVLQLPSSCKSFQCVNRMQFHIRTSHRYRRQLPGCQWNSQCLVYGNGLRGHSRSIKPIT